MTKQRPNSLCECNSGLKYKKCCGRGPVFIERQDGETEHQYGNRFNKTIAEANKRHSEKLKAIQGTKLGVEISRASLSF